MRTNNRSCLPALLDYRQSILLKEKLHEAGVDVQLVLCRDFVHGERRFDELAMTELITRFVSDAP